MSSTDIYDLKPNKKGKGRKQGSKKKKDNSSIQQEKQEQLENEEIVQQSSEVDDEEMLQSKLSLKSDGLDGSGKDIRHHKKSQKWTDSEDSLLKQLVTQYGEKNWRKISEYMNSRSPIQCLHRWSKILKPGLVKGPWSPEEDEKLLEWVKINGPQKWSMCSETIIGRSGKQCRERWFNNLNPNVKKGNWTAEEDEIIFKGYLEMGSSWSRIAKNLIGRTENSVKNRFYSTVRKLLADSEKVDGNDDDTSGQNMLKKAIKLQLQKEAAASTEMGNSLLQFGLEDRNSQEESKNDRGLDDDEEEEDDDDNNGTEDDENYDGIDSVNQQAMQKKKKKKQRKNVRKGKKMSKHPQDILNQLNDIERKSMLTQQNAIMASIQGESFHTEQNKFPVINNSSNNNIQDERQNLDSNHIIEQIPPSQQHEELSQLQSNLNLDQLEISKALQQQQQEPRKHLKNNNKEAVVRKNSSSNNFSNNEDDEEYQEEDDEEEAEEDREFQSCVDPKKTLQKQEIEDENDENNVSADGKLSETSGKRKYCRKKILDEYSAQNLLYRRLKEQQVPIKKTSCMKDYSIFYKKYKQNKYMSKKHNKDSEKIRNLKKEIEVSFSNKGGLPLSNQESAELIDKWNYGKHQNTNLGADHTITTNKQQLQQQLQQQQHQLNIKQLFPNPIDMQGHMGSASSGHDMHHLQQLQQQQQHINMNMMEDKNKPMNPGMGGMNGMSVMSGLSGGNATNVGMAGTANMNVNGNNPQMQEIESRIMEFFNKSITEIVKNFQTEFLKANGCMMPQGNSQNLCYNLPNLTSVVVSNTLQQQQQQGIPQLMMMGQGYAQQPIDNKQMGAQQNFSMPHSAPQQQMMPLPQHNPQQPVSQSLHQRTNTIITNPPSGQGKETSSQSSFSSESPNISEKLKQQQNKQFPVPQNSSIQKQQQQMPSTAPVSSAIATSINSNGTYPLGGNGSNQIQVKLEQQQSQQVLQQPNMNNASLQQYFSDEQIQQHQHLQQQHQIQQTLRQQIQSKIFNQGMSAHGYPQQGGCSTDETKVDQKMLFLLQQLNALESMLSQTKKELFRLEASMQMPQNDSQLPTNSSNNSLVTQSSTSKKVPTNNKVQTPGPQKDNQQQNQQQQQPQNQYTDFENFFNGNI